MALRTLITVNNQDSISKFAIPLFLKLDQNRQRNLPSSILFTVGLQFEKREEWKSLFKISKYDPGTVLKVLFASNNPTTVSDYVQSNIRSMSVKDKRFFLENLILSYKLELLDSESLQLLKKDLDQVDLAGLEQLELLADSQQCKLCTENSISKYFSCLDAQKYRHGACVYCFDQVRSSKNAACPWCRVPNEEE